MNEMLTCVELGRLIATIMGVALVVACSDSSAASPQGTATTSLSHVNWAAVSHGLDCSDIDRGIEVNDVRYADVTGDGAEEAFVWVNCRWPWGQTPVAQHRRGAVLEVFDGSSDPKDPKRIGVLIRETDNLRNGGKLTFSGNTVTVDGSVFDEEDWECCPSLRFLQSFTWLGNGFKAGERTVRKEQLLFFDYSNSNIPEHTGAEEILDNVANIVKSRPGSRVELIGHTDAKENAAISQKRARNVAAALVIRGVPSDHISITGVGYSKPALTARGREPQNRRVQIDILLK